MPFEIGQKVTVHGHYDGPRSLRVVKDIGKKQITLSDGSKWTLQGRVWGASSRYYSGECIAPVQDGDAETIRRKRLTNRLDLVNWREQPTAVLEAVYALLHPTLGGNERGTAAEPAPVPESAQSSDGEHPNTMEMDHV